MRCCKMLEVLRDVERCCGCKEDCGVLKGCGRLRGYKDL